MPVFLAVSTARADLCKEPFEGEAIQVAGKTVTIPKITIAYVQDVVMGMNAEILEQEPYFEGVTFDLPVIGLHPAFMRQNGISPDPETVVRIQFGGGYVRARILPQWGLEPFQVLLPQHIGDLMHVGVGYPVAIRPDRDETPEEKQFMRFLWGRPSRTRN